MTAQQAQYRDLEASELFCPRCKKAQPVRQHLLLVLPSGNKFEYRCARCGASVGSRDDGDPRDYVSTLGGMSRV